MQFIRGTRILQHLSLYIMPPGPVAKKFECITQISMNIFATEIIIYNNVNLVLFSAAQVDLAKSIPSHLVFPLCGAPVALTVG